MKCPFIPGSCIGRECPGWSLGKCFLEIFLQKMDNISLKLDTLCNLSSITATAHIQKKKTDPAPSSRATKIGVDPDKTERSPENLWEMRAEDERVVSEAGGLKAASEEPVHTMHRTMAAEEEPLTPQDGPQDGPQNELFPDFPVKVSDFSFLSDLTEDLPHGMGGSPVRIEVTELPMESPPAEELTAGPYDEVAVNERLLLTGPPTNGSGIQTVPDDNISPEFYEDPVPVTESSLNSVIGQEPPEQVTKAIDAIDPIDAIDALDLTDATGTIRTTGAIDVTAAESSALATSTETLSVEHVIDDITGDTTGDIAGDIPSDTAGDITSVPAVEKEMAPAAREVVPGATVPQVEPAMHVEPTAQVEPSVILAATPVDTIIDVPVADLVTGRVEEPTPVAAQPVAAQEEPASVKARGETSPVLETRAEPVVADVKEIPEQRIEQTVEHPRLGEEPKRAAAGEPPSAAQPEKAPPASPEILYDAPEAQGAPAFVEPSLESTPAEEGIEVLVEEMPRTGPDATASSDPASWQPIDVVEARGGAVLGIDFGSALSKVALKPDAASPATAIPLGLTAYDILHKAGLMSRFESENEYVEDSLVYFDQNEFVFCGALAKKLSMEASESGEGRPAIQNLKTFLVRGGANLQIHSDFFPASESMDSQSVLAVYLAYLLRLTRHYLSKRASKIPTDLDSTLRAFAIPTWIEDRYKEDVKRLFRGAAASAFCLERWLKDDLVRGVKLHDLKTALDEAHQYRLKLEDNLVGSIMTESVAGGNSRLIGLAHEKARPLTLLIVDVGAGFTDFALFSLSNNENQGAQPTAQVAYKGGVGTGLGVWDNALKTLLFNKVKDVPAARRRTNEFRTFKARVELLVRDIKEQLLATNEAVPVDVSPVLPEPVMIERAELESSLPVKAALFGIRDGLRTYIKEAIKALGMHRFDPAHTEILITGGGAYMPSVVDCVREAVATLGPAYPARVRSDYVSALYASIPNIAKLYPLLSVSLGATEDEAPDEQLTTAAAPVAPPGNARAPQQPRAAANATATAKSANKLRLA